MEPRLSLVTIGVADLARARRFYVEGLGWQARFATEEIVFIELNGLILGLFPLAALAADARLPQPPGIGGIALAQNVRSPEEVDRVLAEAVRAGARLLKAGEQASWGGYTGYFADPDGHPWEVAFNPHWTLRADGSVTLG